MELENFIRDVPDFPKKGILFKDITPLLQDAKAFKNCIDRLRELHKGQGIDLVVGPESRGFVFGTALAYCLGVGFAPVRKPGKLPYKTISEEYELEYGKNSVSLHVDAVAKGQRVLLIDDLMATGGTAEACCKLVKKLGGALVAFDFVVELTFLKGREKVEKYTGVNSLIKY